MKKHSHGNDWSRNFSLTGLPASTVTSSLHFLTFKRVPLFLKEKGSARGKAHSFTLIELLVVIAIIAILAAILLPALNNARRRAMAANCVANLKQHGTCMDLYTSDNQDYFPFYCYGDDGKPGKNIWAAVMAHHGYIKDLEILFCPDSSVMDMYSSVGGQESICTAMRKSGNLPSLTDIKWKYITYGYNALSVGGNGSSVADMSNQNTGATIAGLSPTLKAGQALRPAGNVLMADSAYKPSAAAAELRGAFAIGPINRKGDGSIAGRHGDSSQIMASVPNGGANILFLDGHVEFIQNVSKHEMSLVSSNFPNDLRYGAKWWQTVK